MITGITLGLEQHRGLECWGNFELGGLEATINTFMDMPTLLYNGHLCPEFPMKLQVTSLEFAFLFLTLSQPL
jgi:hypothetical protein